MTKLHTPLAYQMLMHVLAMVAGTSLPASHRALIKPKGHHDSLKGTPMAEQSKHQRYNVCLPP